MKTLLTSITAASVAFILVGSNTSYADTYRCQALLNDAPKSIDINVTMQAPNKEVKSPFCLVSGVIPQRLGSDGKFYPIKFELRLPDNWKGRFAYQFNEGHDGEVKPALGATTGLVSSQHAINQGFAVVSSDGGHDANAHPEADLLGSVMFAHQAEARRDYGYAAVQKLNPVARQLVELYYQSPIKYSYGIGQSNGGRLAMVMASRFPTMFDGLLAGSPGFNAPKAALQHAWDTQALHSIDHDITQSLTKRDLDFFAQSILNKCDALDGLQDDMVFNSAACQTAFEPKSLICKGKFDRECLPLNKIIALMKMHQGPHNSKGQALYSSWVYDTGIRSNNWRMWKIESDITQWRNKPVGVVMGAASLAHLYTTPFSTVKGDIFSLENYLLKFDFDIDAPKIYASNKQFKNSAMELITPLDVSKPQLSWFKEDGGKMIIFHGNSDPVYSVKDTARWYDFLDFGLHGYAQEFVKFYRIPGMPHGQGGPSADQFNMLRPLVEWVERGKEPHTITASTRLDNPEITIRMAGVTRPLCPYPAYAQYKSGNHRDASSFRCVSRDNNLAIK